MTFRPVLTSLKGRLRVGYRVKVTKLNLKLKVGKGQSSA